MKQMMYLRYQDGTLMTDHVNVFQDFVNQLSGMNVKFDDEVLSLWFLGTLPDSWETFRTLSNAISDGVITMRLVKNSVLNEETRRKSQGSASQLEVLVIKNRGRSQSRGLKNRDRSKSKSNRFANVECYHYGKKGL